MSRKRLVISLCAVFFGALALLSGGTNLIASASTIFVDSRIFDGLFGSYVQVANTVFAVDQGFARAANSILPSGNIAGSPVTFSSSVGRATNGITAGDWVVTFAVNTTGKTLPNTAFTVTLQFNQGGSSSALKLYLATGSTVNISPPNEVLCEFDIGTTLFSPYSYTLTIQ